MPAKARWTSARPAKRPQASESENKTNEKHPSTGLRRVFKSALAAAAIKQSSGMMFGADEGRRPKGSAALDFDFSGPGFVAF